MNLNEVLESADIDGAIEETAQRVKQAPTDESSRYLLAELHCVNADWKRADAHLDAIYRQQEKLTPQVTIFRQLLRAAQTRDECFEQGRLPTFQQQPSPTIELHLKALLAMRDNNLAEAKQLLDEADSTRPRVRGELDGEAYDDLRDMDDSTASFVEVMSATGEYFWFPFEQLTHIDFSEPKRLRDLLWRPAQIGTQGPIGNVYLPCLYPGSHHHDDPRVRLGQMTDWIGDEGEPIRGIGLRMWLVGEQDRSILDLTRLTLVASPPKEA